MSVVSHCISTSLVDLPLLKYLKLAASNSSTFEPLKISGVLLNWDSSALITYKLRVFQTNEEDGNFEASAVYRTGVVILVIEKPNFLKQTVFNLNGILLYGVANLEYQINIPQFKILVDDFSDMLLETKTSEVLRGNPEDLLSLYSSYEHYHLSGEITSFITKGIKTIFGIDCMFREIGLKDKNMFLVDGLSTNLNGILLEILEDEETKFNFVVICRSEDVMVQLLHYLYKNIAGLQIFPRGEKPLGGSFRESVIHEIAVIEEYYKKGDEDKKLSEILKFRNELNDVQYEVDKWYCLSDM